MRNVQLTPQESLLLRKVEGAIGTASHIPLFPHGNNLVVVDDEASVPKVVRAVEAMVALGWDEEIVEGLVAKLSEAPPETVLSWSQPEPHREDGNREYVSDCGRFTIEVAWFIGDRGGYGTAYTAKDSQDAPEGLLGHSSRHRWCKQLNEAVAWCESRAQGRHITNRKVGRVHIKGKTRLKEREYDGMGRRIG